MDLQAFDFVYRDPITEVAVEPVGLLDQQNAARGILAKVSDHRIKAGAARALRGFDVGECRGD